MVEGYKYGVIILAGGQGKRMGGVEKAKLSCGTTNFLSIVKENLSSYSPIYLSTNDLRTAKESGLIGIRDILPGLGPMGGIYSVMENSDCDAYLVIPCDMIFFTGELADHLMLSHQGEAVIYYEERGVREYPLCGIYSRDCLPVIKKLIGENNFRMRQICSRMGGRKLPIPEKYLKTPCFMNINTPKEYQEASLLYKKNAVEGENFFGQEG